MARGFLLHFTARSGSTYFIFRLRNHPQVEAKAEIFGDARLPDGAAQTAESQLAYARTLWRDFAPGQPPPATSRGFKLQHMWANPHVRDLDGFLAGIADLDLQHMILRRENRLAQVTSAIVARELQQLTEDRLGKAHAHLFSNVAVEAEEVRARKLTVAPRRILHMIGNLERSYAVLDAIERRVPNVHAFAYEAMVRQGPAFFAEVFARLGVADAVLPAAPETRKIAPEAPLEVFENRAEIEQALRASPHARYLETGG